MDRSPDVGRNSWFDFFHGTQTSPEEHLQDAATEADFDAQNSDGDEGEKKPENKGFWPACRGFGGFARRVIDV